MIGLSHRALCVLIGLVLTIGSGCSRTADLELELLRPAEPDPFVGVERLQLLAVADGERIDLGRWRWDVGPVALDQAIAPSFERFVVLGLDAAGTVIASGSSPALDVVRDPPGGPVPVFFGPVGQLARLSTHSGPRAFGFAAPYGDAVVFGGGRDPSGCPNLDLQEVGFDGIGQELPPLPEARVSTRPLELSDGSVVLLGGTTGASCGSGEATTTVTQLFPASGTARTDPWSDVFPGGASLAALEEGRWVVAGGTGTPVARTDVSLAEPSSPSLRVTRIGSLDRPRAFAAAESVTPSRVLFIGGNSATSTNTLIRDAVAFDLSSGQPVAATSVFDSGRAQLASTLLASGAVVVAGGVSGAGASNFLSTLFLRSELSGALRPRSDLPPLVSAGPGQLLDLRDGSLLFIPEATDADLSWVHLLPRRVQPVPRPEASVGGLVGAVLEPGRALLEGEDGSRWSFQSGPAAVLSAAAPELGEPGAGLPSGLIPLDPNGTDYVSGQLVLTGPDSFDSQLGPEQLVVIRAQPTTDFELTVRYRLSTGQARPSVVFGLGQGDYDQMILQATPQVLRSPLRRSGPRILCDSVELPELTRTEPLEVRVRRSRSGQRVSLDVGADGSEEQQCDTPLPRAGLIALGVVNGQVTFEDVRLRNR